MARDILAWCQLFGLRIHPEEADILRQMDASYRTTLAAEISENFARKNPPKGGK